MTELLNTTDLDPRFKRTVYLVEGHDFYDWEKWHRFLKWEQNSPGKSYTIGYLGDRPVTITFFWNKLNGVYVAWWSADSQLVDHKMIDEWFRAALPDIARCDQMNFGQALAAVKRYSGIEYHPGHEALTDARSTEPEEKWENIQTSLDFGDIEGALDELTDEERQEIVRNYCRSCGKKTLACWTCANKE